MTPQTESEAVAEQITMVFEEVWAAYVEPDVHTPNRFDTLDTMASVAAEEAIYALDTIRKRGSMNKVKAVALGLRDNFRTGARTLGISPKALAPFIGAGVTALLAVVGLTPAEIGSWIGVDAPVIAGGIATVAATAAAALLPPGRVEPVKPKRSSWS